MATNISINASVKIADASPLILGGNRNHVDDYYGWWTIVRNGLRQPGFRASVIQHMREMQARWGSTAFGRNTFLYRLGHGPTDGRKDWGTNPDGTYKVPGYHYANEFGETGIYPYDDIKFGLDEAVEMGATPIMVVNYGTGTETEAGNLAAYCNKTVNTERQTHNAARYNSRYSPFPCIEKLSQSSFTP